MKSSTIVTACVIAMGLATQMHAASLEIQFLGLNLVYNGSAIYDSKDIAGGSGVPAEADPLTSMDFLVDGTSVGKLTTEIWADVFIPVIDISAAGGVATTLIGDSFGFDILMSAGGFGLALNLVDFDVFYAGNEISVAGGSTASGIHAQNLPFGLAVSDFDDIAVAFSSANLSNVTDDGVHLTGFVASGTGNVKGVLVPEPTSATMLFMAGLGLLVVRLGRPRP